MKELPKPEHKYGYPRSQVKKICRKLRIPWKKFSDSFGVNTCSMDEKTNEIIMYRCDVERAFHSLGNKLGRYHEWD